jgi:hypothetical protein
LVEGPDIRFCDGCNQSITRRELDEGRVVKVGERLFHPACAPRGWPGWLPWVLLAPALALGVLVGSLLFRTAAGPAGKTGPDPEVEGRLAALQGQVRGLSAQVEASTAETSKRLVRLHEDVRIQQATLLERGEELQALVEAMEEMAQALATPPAPAPAPEAGPDGPTLAELVLETRSPRLGRRFSALHALHLRPETEALEALRTALADKSPRIRAYAAQLLGARRERTTAGELVALLRDEDASVREASHRALRLISGLDFPFDALGPEDERERQARSWEKWWRERANGDGEEDEEG